MARYAKRLTKEDLMSGGITNITEDCKIYGSQGELPVHQSHKQGYIILTIYECDENGNKIKVQVKRTLKGCKNPSDTYVYKTRSIGLHRAMWAWFHNEVPEGMVVDHINNKHTNIEDYYLSNLQLLTPQENITKERECNTRMLKCKLDRPRSYYEEKLKRYEELYEEAKEAKDADKAHTLRGNIAQCRARLRYWDTNRKEIESIMSRKAEYTKSESIRLEAKRKSVKERKILNEWKKIFKEKGNTAMWHQICKIIKNWDTYTDMQKDHVFEVLEKTFKMSITV